MLLNKRQIGTLARHQITRPLVHTINLQNVVVYFKVLCKNKYTIILNTFTKKECLKQLFKIFLLNGDYASETRRV